MSYFNDKLIKCDFEFQDMKVSLYKDVTVDYNSKISSYVLNDLKVDKIFIQIDDAMGFEIDLDTLNALNEMIKSKSEYLTKFMDEEVINWEEEQIGKISAHNPSVDMSSESFKEWFKDKFDRDLKGN